MIPHFEDERITREKLYPFALLREVLDIRIGILTIREKWARLNELFPHLNFHLLKIPSHLVPSLSFADAFEKGEITTENLLQHPSVRVLDHPWHIFEYNDWALREDFELLTRGRYSHPIPETVQTIKSTSIFLEEGATIGHCILNASTGPIYIAKGSEIMEGTVIRGPFALCEGSVLKMGARIYGATTVGPYSVVGGEVKNSVIFGFSNKAHDGYLGDSVIAEWCNLGAGTSNSNIRNTASTVKLWHQPFEQMLDAGLKCGLLMGDFSRSAINTSFNTATVVGIASNVFGEGLTPKYIPDFSWGISGIKYEYDKAIQDIRNWKKLKNKELSEKEIQILKTIFEGK